MHHVNHPLLKSCLQGFRFSQFRRPQTVLQDAKGPVWARESKLGERSVQKSARLMTCEGAFVPSVGSAIDILFLICDL